MNEWIVESSLYEIQKLTYSDWGCLKEDVLEHDCLFSWAPFCAENVFFMAALCDQKDHFSIYKLNTASKSVK